MKEQHKKEKQSLFVEGTEYKTYLPDDFDKRRGFERPRENMLSAFIPGTVTRIYVRQGQKVRKGDKMIVLEAMKMKNQLLAPLDGVVEEILVQEGERVVKSQPLLFLHRKGPEEGL